MQAVVRSILDKVWETGNIYKDKYEGGSNFSRPLPMASSAAVYHVRAASLFRSISQRSLVAATFI